MKTELKFNANHPKLDGGNFYSEIQTTVEGVLEEICHSPQDFLEDLVADPEDIDKIAKNLEAQVEVKKDGSGADGLDALLVVIEWTAAGAFGAMGALIVENIIYPRLAGRFPFLNKPHFSSGDNDKTDGDDSHKTD